MKKFYLLAVMAVISLSVSAQQTLNISTYSGSDLTKYEGLTKNVSLNRYMFQGWNTICLPISLTEAEVNEAFGSDCRLETLVGVENNGAEIILNFQDVKEGGIQANHPYIIYFNNETQNVRVSKENATIKNDNTTVSFSDNQGITVTFAGTYKKHDSKGLYGILAKDNSESSFVNVDNYPNGFFATRCFITLSNGNSTTLKANHIKAGDITAINSVLASNERVDVYNVSGVKVGQNMSVNDINNLNKGVYVIKGKKIAVK